MTFHSILFETPGEHLQQDAPRASADLHLDQIIEAITSGKEEYQLKPFFYTPLRTPAAVQYRHEVMQDLERPLLSDQIKSFAQGMMAMREHLAQAESLRYRYQKEWWFLNAMELYCNAIVALARDLTGAALHSRGLLAFCNYLGAYAHSDRFTLLSSETKQLKAELSRIRYSLLIKENSITVRHDESEKDYSVEVENTFAKFQQGAVKDYIFTLSAPLDMNHVEAKALEFVAQLNPETFSRLGRYCATHRTYIDDTIARFDREIQFYLAYLDYLAIFKRAGLPVCYPNLSTDSKDIYAYETFDFALAHQLLRSHSSVICNDFYLKDQERMLVVTGPNQGGKTTFARTFGQVHYLASLGCPVTGRDARLFLFDRLFTYFEKEETITTLRGKLEDDLVRIREILTCASPNSLVIINEVFTATTFQDALFLSTKVMERLLALDMLGVWVTFLDELASMSPKTVSMVGTVLPKNPTVRTYKIIRRQADGLAYALSVAEQYRLTYERLKERLPA